MFGRRKRSSSHHQPLPASATQSAQSAASHAFLRSQSSSSSLSSAAAAAALRSLTPTPTSVENVQTKRMAQRRGSTQSPTSPMGRRSASVSGPLRRSNSSSSMTARTFREPSPHRPSNSSSPVDVPPLPSLPPQYASRKLPNRRAVSMEPPMRPPPSSPPRAGARGISGDRERVPQAAAAHSYSHTRVSSLGTVPELERSVSRSSVNFSYPMGSRPSSPTSPLQSRPMNVGAIHDLPRTTTGPPSPQQLLAQTPENPTTPMLKAQAPASTEESHVTSKSAGAATIGTAAAAAAAAQAVSLQKNSPRVNSVSTRHKRAVDGTSATSPPDRYAGTASPVAISGTENEHPSSPAVPNRLPAVVPEDDPAHTTDAGIAHARGRDTRVATASPTVDHVERAAAHHQSVPSAERELAQQPHLRQSSSPGRSAHFAKLLSVTAAGDQVHEPPPRSVSPFKSALKHPRGNSLSPDRKAGVANRAIQPPSEMSDGTSVASDEGPRIGVKKKPVKVSFDDEAEIVGVAASPPTSPEEPAPESPTGRHKSRTSWFGVGKKKTSHSDYATSDDGFDVVMKPRPVLPSFGSVRANREAGPSSATIQEFSDNESSSSSESNVVAASDMSSSKDNAFGGMLPTVQRKETQPAHVVNSLQQKSIIGETPSQGPAGPGVKSDAVPVAGITEQGTYSGVDSQPFVPAIAVEPPTPQTELQASSLEQHVILNESPQSSSNRDLNATTDTDEAQPVASAVLKPDDMDAEGESGDSVYSDAAEEMEGDGFGSINAIVDAQTPHRTSAPLGTLDSRETTPKPGNQAAIVESHQRDATDQTVDEMRSETPTQASFSGQIDRSAPNEVLLESPSPSPRIKSTGQASSMQIGAVRPEPNRQRRPMSMDAQEVFPSQEARWKENSASQGTAKSKPRPVSLGPAFQASNAFPDTLRRTMSNGSDSSSSFKRSGPSSRGDAPHTMRRTMRAGNGHIQILSQPVRTESPNEHRPLSAGSTTGTMRTTLRGPPSGTERYSFFSTNNKAQKTKSGKLAIKKTRSSRFNDSDDEGETQPQSFRSRFADSSDEDELGRNSLQPVRGIPRRHGTSDGDSTELEDSSEEDYRQQPVIARRSDSAPPGSREKNAAPNMSGMAAVARQRGMTQRELEEFLMQPPGGRKPGLLTRLGLKKPKNAGHRIRKADVESPSRRDTPLERSRLEREEIREEPWATGTHDGQASSPKLLKRSTKRHTLVGESWPFRDDPKDEAAGTAEPAVAEHPPRTGRVTPSADNTNRNGSIVVNGGTAGDAPKEPESPQTVRSEPLAIVEDHGPSARDVVIAGSGRKKRFPLFRKAFHLRLPSLHKD